MKKFLEQALTSGDLRHLRRAGGELWEQTETVLRSLLADETATADEFELCRDRFERSRHAQMLSPTGDPVGIDDDAFVELIVFAVVMSPVNRAIFGPDFVHSSFHAEFVEPVLDAMRRDVLARSPLSGGAR